MKPSSSTQPIDAHMGEEEKKKKEKEEQKKQGVGPQPSYMDHLVASYNPHGSYSGAYSGQVGFIYIYI